LRIITALFRCMVCAALKATMQSRRNDRAADK